MPAVSRGRPHTRARMGTTGVDVALTTTKSSWTRAAAGVALVAGIVASLSGATIAARMRFHADGRVAKGTAASLPPPPSSASGPPAQSANERSSPMHRLSINRPTSTYGYLLDAALLERINEYAVRAYTTADSAVSYLNHARITSTTPSFAL